MVDLTSKGGNSTPTLTAEIAASVYTLIKEAGNADLAFKAQSDSAIDPEHFILVDKEIDRILAELRKYRSGSVVLEPAIPAVYDEEGNVTEEEVPAVMYEYTTDADLISQVSSDLLDVETVFNDLFSYEEPSE